VGESKRTAQSDGEELRREYSFRGDRGSKTEVKQALKRK